MSTKGGDVFSKLRIGICLVDRISIVGFFSLFWGWGWGWGLGGGGWGGGGVGWGWGLGGGGWGGGWVGVGGVGVGALSKCKHITLKYAILAAFGDPLWLCKIYSFRVIGIGVWLCYDMV